MPAPGAASRMRSGRTAKTAGPRRFRAASVPSKTLAEPTKSA